MTTIPKYSWQAYQGPTQLLWPRRQTRQDIRYSTLHSHEYAEVFWVERGRGWHVMEQERVLLEPGDVWFIRPEHIHTLRADASGIEFCWVNVAWDADFFANCERRYQDLGWPWQEKPHCLRFSPQQIAQLNDTFFAVTGEDQNICDADWCMSYLMRTVRHAQPDLVPQWFAQGLEQWFADDEAFSLGVTMMVEFMGHSRRQVARIVRDVYAMSLSAFVRQHQLTRSAKLLHQSNDEILAIALICGFDNLSYFYRCFRERYGVSPGRYRQQAPSNT